MEIKLHTCTISRRGKAAKGTVEVSTFGVPVKPKKGTTIKKWLYDFVDDMSVRDCLDAVEQAGQLNVRLIKEAILRGADLIKKSNSIQQQSESASLVRWIMEEDLAMDLDSAENLVKVWQQTQAFMKRSMMAIPSIEDLSEQRRKYVNAQKEAGLWKTALVIPEDVQEDDEEEQDAE